MADEGYREWKRQLRAGRKEWKRKTPWWTRLFRPSYGREASDGQKGITVRPERWWDPWSRATAKATAAVGSS